MALSNMDPMESRGFSPGWFEYAEHIAEVLDIGPGTSVFEVGCRGGELLYPLAENGFTVGGIDPSADLIKQAGELIPGGCWSVGEASTLDPGEAWKVVVSRAFADFPDLDYARGVIARMAAKASHAIALLELTDEYDRGWLLRTLNEVGVQGLQIEEAGERFHVFARVT
jgi:SAM-dependent methyltransferase